MSTWLQALVLGIVQGLTEFIPISSSAHLVLVPAYAGWERPGLAFDVALHVGTAAALVVYYRRDLGRMLVAVLSRESSPERQFYRRLVGMLAIASVPVAIAGGLFRSSVELAFESPALASGLLLATAVLLLVGERVRSRRLPMEVRAAPPDTPEHWQRDIGSDPDDPVGADLAGMRLRQAVFVGLGQAVAIVPGLSRSGTTITAGLVAGLTRPAATHFAFLLALPAIMGATIVSIPDMADLGHYSMTDLGIGMLGAAVSGYLAIAGLVRLVSRAGLQYFSIYLVILAAVGLIVFL